MKTRLFLSLLLFCIGQSSAQTENKQVGVLTIETCYHLAKEQYPLVKQLELVRKSSDYSLENAAKGYLPQISINGQATYQSEVTRIPINIPNMAIPTLSKDQYKLYAEVNQVIYDGGAIAQQQNVLEANRATEEQKIEVELYRLKERINQLYFGILLIDGQLEQIALLRQDLELGITKTNALITNGTAFKSAANVLKAEVLKTDQRVTELQALRTAYIEMLGLFIQQPLTPETKLTTPAAVQPQTEIRRPELTLYALQQQSVDAGYGLLAAKNRPKLSLFVQGGYGRPALNMLSNDFAPYAIGGIRLNWSISGFYTLKNERSALQINRSAVDVQRELFLLNTQITLRQQHAEVAKLQELLQTDDAIIDLRASTKTVSATQLENGVINTNDYLRDVNAEDQARLNKLLHEIQLLQAQYNQQITTGI